MHKRKNVSVLVIGIVVLCLVMIIALVYAGFTGQLNISGSAVGRDSKWDIHFENVSSITTTGTAKVLNNHQPVINSNNPTQIQDYEVSLTSPTDSISFTFDVVNDGNYNAKITSVNVSAPQCSSTDTVSATNMCNNLTYSITYSSGASIQTNDVVYAKDKVSMKVTLTFNAINDASLLPDAGVSISNLGIQINFEQQGNALIKDNGEVADYRVYHQGDKITLNNEDYYVIVNSGAGQDYVVALKENPLTVAEVNLYGGVGTENNHVNRNDAYIVGTAGNVQGNGAISYYSSETCGNNTTTGCTNDYNDSDIKYIVDEWAKDKFTDELKEVDGYDARLITNSEYEIIPNNYEWRYNSSYSYWTMTKYPRVSDAYRIFINGVVKNAAVYRSYLEITVRPVINVYKTALETNNNE